MSERGRSLDELKAVVKPYSLGLFVVDKAEKDFMVRCPFCHLVKWGSSSAGFKTWNKCFLSGEHCPYRGRKVRFKVNHVVWNCPLVVGLVAEGGNF